jgi:hypothetical protein
MPFDWVSCAPMSARARLAQTAIYVTGSQIVIDGRVLLGLAD